MALSVAYAALGDPHAAGDAVQDGFAKAWQKLPGLNDPARFGTWLCGIVRNGAIDQRRRARLAPKPIFDRIPDAATPAAAGMSGTMTAFALPAGTDAVALRRALWERRVEIPVIERPDRLLLRVSHPFFTTEAEL